MNFFNTQQWLCWKSCCIGILLGIITILIHALSDDHATTAIVSTENVKVITLVLLCGGYGLLPKYVRSAINTFYALGCDYEGAMIDYVRSAMLLVCLVFCIVPTVWMGELFAHAFGNGLFAACVGGFFGLFLGIRSGIIFFGATFSLWHGLVRDLPIISKG